MSDVKIKGITTTELAMGDVTFHNLCLSSCIVFFHWLEIAKTRSIGQGQTLAETNRKAQV